MIPKYFILTAKSTYMYNFCNHDGTKENHKGRPTWEKNGLQVYSGFFPNKRRLGKRNSLGRISFGSIFFLT